MSEIRFYHLERSSLDQALPAILSMAHSRGMRALIKCADQGLVDHLDDWLWRFQAESFLPHASADSKQAKDNPIVLTTGDENVNEATLLIVLNEAETPLINDDAFELSCLIFDGRDENVVTHSRKQWLALKEDGRPLTYFQQDENGKWGEKASENKDADKKSASA